MSAVQEVFKRQGSKRRVIPLENKKELFGRQNEDLNKMYRAIKQEYIILAEYQMVQSENVPGIYVIPSRENPFVWFGVIFVRSGIYEDGIFRFEINLHKKFPESEHPIVKFSSETLHPLINPETYELFLLSGFPRWSKSEQHIWQIVKYIYWIFTNFDASLSHLEDKEAVERYREDSENFSAKIKEIVEKSQTCLATENDPSTYDKHYLIFEEYDPEIHSEIEKTMLNENKNITAGPSWVLTGTFAPLTRPPTPQEEDS